MEKIKKTDMAARAVQVATTTPSISDRLAHAHDLTSKHPASEERHLPATNTSTRHTKQAPVHCIAVPVELIDVNPYNARAIYRPERVRELATSIGANGQDVPGIATPRNGRYVLSAGHYRLLAIKLLRHETMDLMIHEGLTDMDLFSFSYRENAERESQTALDNALAWRNLLNNKLFNTETELAEATGISLPNVNKTLKILSLSEPVMEIVKEAPADFAMTVLYELVLYESVAGQQKTMDIAKQIKSGEISRTDINEARKALEQPKNRKPKETSRQYKINHDGQTGTLKIWTSGRMALDVKLPVDLDAAKREAIITNLKSSFGINE